MSPEENIQVVQKAYADFGRGDIPAILAALDENVEWTTPGGPAVPTSGIRRGKAAVGEFFRAVDETWSFDSFEPRQFLASGDRVLATGHYVARSRKTGGTAACDWAMVWTLRGGKATSFREYTDTAAMVGALSGQSARTGA
ncbi:MAG TPA: nuclear transport factor 2 family protein [Bryobacteraceae bacterium]|nr:nuclear transport factor 2 family protein [Bryobacteraceae bacterium]